MSAPIQLSLRPPNEGPNLLYTLQSVVRKQGSISIYRNLISIFLSFDFSCSFIFHNSAKLKKLLVRGPAIETNPIGGPTGAKTIIQWMASFAGWHHDEPTNRKRWDAVNSSTPLKHFMFMITHNLFLWLFHHDCC
jgi:hypothetical protein